jgi:hypothetical protein
LATSTLGTKRILALSEEKVGDARTDPPWAYISMLNVSNIDAPAERDEEGAPEISRDRDGESGHSGERETVER